MLLKQLSVFIENREGRLEEVAETLAKNDINILTFSLADTSEYGLLRMIVDEPDKGKMVLNESDFTAMLTDVIAVKVPSKVGALNRILKTLSGVNIEYIYVLATGNTPSIIIKSDDAQVTIDQLEKDGFELLGEDAYIS
jgi:hypothetical protein